MKRSARTENTVQEAARVGEELREARIALGVSVEDAATQLRINKRYLQALANIDRRIAQLLIYR